MLFFLWGVTRRHFSGDLDSLNFIYIVGFYIYKKKKKNCFGQNDQIIFNLVNFHFYESFTFVPM